MKILSPGKSLSFWSPFESKTLLRNGISEFSEIEERMKIRQKKFHSTFIEERDADCQETHSASSNFTILNELLVFSPNDFLMKI